MSLCALVYVSLAEKEMSDQDLQILLKFARIKNERLGITGLLLYRDGFFMQALEGEEEAVDGLFARIRQDTRHRDVLLLYKETIRDRAFPDWTMGFNKMDSEGLAKLEGFSDFLARPAPGFFLGQPAKAKALLANFRDHLFF